MLSEAYKTQAELEVQLDLRFFLLMPDDSIEKVNIYSYALCEVSCCKMIVEMNHGPWFV